MIGVRKHKTFECPRRAEAPFRLPGDNGKDTWRKGVGLVGQARGCSYCGSMNPDDFMARVREGFAVGPTDKSYKVYLHAPVTDKVLAESRARWVESAVGRATVRVAVAESRDPEQALAEDWEKFELSLVQGPDVGKFYLRHLSEDQRREFFDLYKAKTMKVGYPGYFYVLPFFMRPAGARFQRSAP